MLNALHRNGSAHGPSTLASHAVGMGNRRVPTSDEIRAWPVTVDVPTAGRAFGLGRDESYRLARAEMFPVPVLRLGRFLRVTRGALLKALEIGDEAQPYSTVDPSTKGDP
ncbi:hypothetical protein Vau01_035830 [Virgisporangium aurantiacum]|uniref:Helix-turn-helix domain-containing protein n=1 Tax=Virgisporangium aurantiacum TaxID=175570 RepID=A0A8J4E1J9_9ACTN|nr:hypothetical protein Vau01_035830 [Virgisporangium aurantiacum]